MPNLIAFAIYYIMATNKYYQYRFARNPFEQDGFFELVLDKDFEIIKISSVSKINNPGNIECYLYVDVTPQVFILDQWKRLDLDRINENARNSVQLKINSLYYELGSTRITNNQLGGLFDDVNAFQAFHKRALLRAGFNLDQLIDLTFYLPNPTLVNVVDVNKAFDFRIEYVPYFNTRIRFRKRQHY